MLGFMYGQTEYQILENAIHLEDYVSFGVSNGFSFLTITDSNLHGHFKFYNLLLYHFLSLPRFLYKRI
jgi:DNA polymerase III alpha subunit